MREIDIKLNIDRNKTYKVNDLNDSNNNIIQDPNGQIKPKNNILKNSNDKLKLKSFKFIIIIILISIIILCLVCLLIFKLF